MVSYTAIDASRFITKRLMTTAHTATISGVRARDGTRQVHLFRQRQPRGRPRPPNLLARNFFDRFFDRRCTARCLSSRPATGPNEEVMELELSEPESAASNMLTLRVSHRASRRLPSRPSLCRFDVVVRLIAPSFRTMTRPPVREPGGHADDRSSPRFLLPGPAHGRHGPDAGRPRSRALASLC
jgi:hypothetical protein